ncbi:MAG: TIGR03557 family F420-dependent LLM class oxidoreductase [Mycolicibacterium sp.]|uniref:TIGR03557 family F420-dependent LLM class oxidoreductase n=1 Tax=Mycolicibacterium sp. TaxID=2320850 RepID=UPI000F940161|nr:TIGR03557 family F420-dependent LLM class oxidoreductase [Mycolicibacterium sp.]RUP34190.1 MAG: TIGR03557 family F420-dependent LLM class oxidoreductase [Mycolicibacterium sp.]
MTSFGYTLMTEQCGPKELVRHAVRAEELGFDFEVCSDHYSPWLVSQGHAPNAWLVLGAVAQATSRVELCSYVTCPTMRYHPAVVAQQAATAQILADGRFLLGLGTGENLNEHVVGQGWPGYERRLDMLCEATKIIRQLLDGGVVNHKGEYFQVDGGRLWDLPAEPVPIGISMTGEKSVQRLADFADFMIDVAPDKPIVDQWLHERRVQGLETTGRAVAQLPICWDRDRDKAVERAHEQFRWFGGGWPTNAELPNPKAFDAATQFVRPEDVADQIPCGPDIDAVVEAVSAYRDAGFTDIALVQIGGDSQDSFFDEAAPALLAALRADAA